MHVDVAAKLERLECVAAIAGRQIVNANSRRSRSLAPQQGIARNAAELTQILIEARAAVEASRRLLKQTNEALDDLAIDRALLARRRAPRKN
jgi:hypothetical protein